MVFNQWDAPLGRLFQGGYAAEHNDQLKVIPFADNTVGRRISDISEDLCGQLIEKVKLPSFVLQVDEATDVFKDAHLITYVCKICCGNWR